MPPSHISHYRLTRRLGEGTDAEVWTGVHVDDADFVVAVKLVHPSVQGDPIFIAALRQERRSLDRMDHPGNGRFRELVLCDVVFVATPASDARDAAQRPLLEAA